MPISLVSDAVDSIRRNTVSPQQSVSNLLGSAASWGTQQVSDIVGGVGKQVVENVAEATGFGKLLRSVNLPQFGMPNAGGYVEAAWGSEAVDDWRVRLSIPSNFNLPAPLQAKLAETNGMIFPYTPQIILQHSASYGSLSPTHNNYTFPTYQHSQVDTIQITGEFYIENADEGIYWIAAIHYLRSVTKMAYGNSSFQGSPPPVVRLNGYGDFVLKNVPVVVTVFNVDLPTDVDYIHVPNIGPQGTWVPTRSQVSVSLQTAYSRRSVQQFSLDKFIAGGYANSNGIGFI